VVVPLNDDGALVEEVRQGHRLRHRRRMGRALSKARGRPSSQGGSALSRRHRWLSVRVLCGDDDCVVAGSDLDEALRLGGKGTRSLGTSQSKKKFAQGGAHLRAAMGPALRPNPAGSAKLR
jgi:hypothetical protein